MEIALLVRENWCANCDELFSFPDLFGGQGSYGQWLVRSEATGNPALVNVFDESSTFDDFSGLAKKFAARYATSDLRVSEYVQTAFAMTADPDVDGSRYSMTAIPRCPGCGWSQVSEWSATDVVVHQDVNLLTHEEWWSLTLEQQSSELAAIASNILGGG